MYTPITKVDLGFFLNKKHSILRSLKLPEIVANFVVQSNIWHKRCLNSTSVVLENWSQFCDYFLQQT